MKNLNESTMKRGQFLRSLGLSTSTLMAFYCMGTTLSSCGSKEDSPSPTGGGGSSSGVTGTTSGNAINFTVDLSNSANSKLKNTGEFKIIGDVLVAFTTDGKYVALAKNCTHEGTELQYEKSGNDLFCSNHGSKFSVTGSVLNGPSSGGTISSLKTFTATLSTDKQTLTVKA